MLGFSTSTGGGKGKCSNGRNRKEKAKKKKKTGSLTGADYELLAWCKTKIASMFREREHLSIL